MEHSSEDALERFAMKRSTDSELEEVEGHILGCQVCLDRVLELESFVQACRDAIPEVNQERARLAAKAGPGNSARRFILTLPKWSWAVPALASLAFLAAIIPNLHQPTAAGLDATLSVSRGIESTPVLPARTVVRLHLDTLDLPAGATQAELVDGEGRSLWSGDVRAQADRITVRTPRLEPGVYFARLYPVQDGQPDRNHLLREFAFQVR